MRTKKILSIFLAIVMTLGLGVIGTSAAGEQAVVQADGWDNVTVITLYENRYHSRGSGTVEIKWDTFRAPDGSTTGTNSFHALYEAGKATLEWSVDREISAGNWIGQRIEANSTAAGAGSGIWVDSITSTAVTLVIGQHNTNKWYGNVRAKLKVTVNGVAKESDYKYAYLTDSKTFAEKIEEAEKELAKTDRYTEKYINNLKAVVSNAKLVLNSKPDDATVALYIIYLNNAINGLDAAGNSVGNRWKLADKNGEGFIDGTLGQNFISFIWKVVDVYNLVKSVADPLFSFFGQIGGIFENIAPIFTFLFGILMP